MRSTSTASSSGCLQLRHGRVETRVSKSGARLPPSEERRQTFLRPARPRLRPPRPRVPPPARRGGRGWCGAGRIPSVAEVAQSAGVSRATAYRYFPVPLEAGERGDRRGAGAGAPRGAAAGRRQAAPARAARPHLLALRGVRAAHARRAPARARAPVAGGRRAARGGALPPRPAHRDPRHHASSRCSTKLPPRTYRRLLQALAVVYGIEPMVILKDICGASDRETEAVVRWMMDALVDAALREH